VALSLRRDERARATTAIRLALADLVNWAEHATSHALAELEGARAGETVVLRGKKLPAVSGERFWGERVLCPLGFTADPALPESALAQALGLEEGEIALVSESGISALPVAAFAKLTRAAVRSAVKP
jgi:hypothetical protein